VILLEVSDFQCPVCRRAYDPYGHRGPMPGVVRLVFKHNPLDMPRNALNAAAAAMRQPARKVRRLADWAFQNQSAWTRPP
jgi:protein-disulfide isomerase